MTKTKDSVTLDEVLRLAKQLSAEDKARLIERVAPQAQVNFITRPDGNRSMLGYLKDVGPAPSVEQIDAARREARAYFITP